MSLGDKLRLLRAQHGGITPVDIEANTALPKGVYRQMEQRYRAVGDDASIRILADFYGVPFDDLRWRLDWPRKALSHALVACMRDQQPITLYLWNGQIVTGEVRWWDLGAVGLETPDGDLVVVQRHAAERWDPRASGDTLAADAADADAADADAADADAADAMD
jgi:sRNA-binding regulator protein Hfq